MTEKTHDDYYSDLQSTALDLSYKLHGIQRLLEGYQPESQCSAREEHDASIGLSMILGDLRAQAYDLYIKLDIVERPKVLSTTSPIEAA
ncbi:MAG: hypothetical protein KF802_03800 [Bdellovibrionaceae bacterium]|nr:hypothetical protein [Pseudobdellovibrionaceae bacterium]